MGPSQVIREIAIKNTSSIFVIVCAPRTGSTLLVRTLQQIGGITCHGELLLGHRVRDYRDSFNVLQVSAEQRAARAERLLQERAANPRKFIDIALHTEAAATGMKVIYEDFLDPRWSDAIW